MIALSIVRENPWGTIPGSLNFNRISRTILSKMQKQVAIIAGAGPAGLTAASELLDKTDIKPVVFEMTRDIGGISKTVNYKGNRIDIGGHRFFSKSDRVMDWWREKMPTQGAPSKDDLLYERSIPLSGDSDAPDPEKTDLVMLVRKRLSRIFFLKSFFDYPISLNLNTIKNLGLVRLMSIGFSYLKARLFPIKEEKSLEDFLINRFGRTLYLLFFKDYTEKVWGVPCDKIKPEWGAQRIKGLSITKAVLHAIKSVFKRDDSLGQKDTETSLIGQFFYPKLGPGQLWELVAEDVQTRGGEIHLGCEIIGLELDDGEVQSVRIKHHDTGEESTLSCDYFFSTMPVKQLIGSIADGVPDSVGRVAEGLVYRDFITVGLLVKRFAIKNDAPIHPKQSILPDNWIYIQEREVKIGRLQVFNNWSPYMVADEDTVWLGLEYFCNEGDSLWGMEDNEFIEFAIGELDQIKVIDKSDVLDATLIRMPKAYPAYFGSYDDFDHVREYTDSIENLFLIGRNGMHRYNNSDHSMLTAMTAVDNIVAGITSKDNIWATNTEQDYHEKK